MYKGNYGHRVEAINNNFLYVYHNGCGYAFRTTNAYALHEHVMTCIEEGYLLRNTGIDHSLIVSDDDVYPLESKSQAQTLCAFVRDALMQTAFDDNADTVPSMLEDMSTEWLEDDTQTLSDSFDIDLSAFADEIVTK